MPTWFCHRNVFERVEMGFHEGGAGVPEDLIFFYKHLNLGGMLQRVDNSLMVYRYNPNATTFSIKEETIWETRLNQFQQDIMSLPAWSRFSIYGAGKLGRRFFRSLRADVQNQVQQFCDIDPKKVQQKRYEPYPKPKKFKIPICSTL
ncbi:unnamed protein product [Allacma fusca]|uniref:Uncharacterized protein n=1 Tax=Allacma fusca TaxID=39272 RepID=A0A8J2JS35_9HEXA|nr:unnamed protein product [Allacma fusca]